MTQLPTSSRQDKTSVFLASLPSVTSNCKISAMATLLRSVLSMGATSLIASGALLTAAPPNARAIDVFQELFLSLDVSGSVNDAQYNQYVGGYVNAFNNPAIKSQIHNTYGQGGVAIAVGQWDFAALTPLGVNWTQINNDTSYAAFVNSLASMPRQGSGGTCTGCGMQAGIDSILNNNFTATAANRRVIDISTDGGTSIFDVDAVSERDRAESNDIIINGLGIGAASTATLTDTVVTRATLSSKAGFVETAATAADFQTAIEAKLLRETGVVSSCTGFECTATGNNSQATGDYSTATGVNSQATGDQTTATGHGSLASGLQGTATGATSRATGNGSTATGQGSQATGFSSTATGHQSQASGVGSTATGVGSLASGNNSTATGVGSQATCGGGEARGDSGGNCTATGATSRATGNGSTATGVSSLASGNNSTATGVGSQATGNGNTAAGAYSRATGALGTATGNNSEATGALSTATGVLSKATGSDTTATGVNSEASGFLSTATGVGSKAAGVNSTATGVFSQATGALSTATGSSSLATGNNSTATGVGSQASGDQTTATGVGAQASGDGSTATGQGSQATGFSSTATGVLSQASGESSTATGNSSLALGASSLALGSGATAGFNNSVAIGANTVAERPNQVIIASRGQGLNTVYTLPGLATGGAFAGDANQVTSERQTRFTTVDNQGNLGTSSFSVGDVLSSFDRINGRLNNIESALGTVNSQIQNVGAIAAALSAIPNLTTDNQRYGCGVGAGGYGSGWAGAAGCAAKIGNHTWVNGALAFTNTLDSGFGSTPSVAGRIGLFYQWGAPTAK